MIARLYQTEIIVAVAYTCVALVVVPQTIYSYTCLPSTNTVRNSFQFIQSIRDQYNYPSFGRSSTRIYSTDNSRRNRRRRKNISGDNDSNIEPNNLILNGFDSDTSSNTSSSDRAELPDFDINDDEDLTMTTAISSERSLSNLSISSVTPNMMASPSTKNGNVDTTILSVDDLRDRSLEKKLESLFIEDTQSDADNSLPDFARIQKDPKTIALEQIPQSSSSLSKKQRQILARQQQDMEQQKINKVAEKEMESENPLSKLPFVTNEKGNVEPIKVLETATWACIMILIAWEVYINSPFFSRAAPIIPIVYDIWI
jgi:hypothetical protein